MFEQIKKPQDYLEAVNYFLKLFYDKAFLIRLSASFNISSLVA